LARSGSYSLIKLARSGDYSLIKLAKYLEVCPKKCIFAAIIHPEKCRLI
jgi:hypothetical protein